MINDVSRDFPFLLRPCLHGRRLTFRGGLHSSIVFPGFVHMLGRVTLEGGSPCLLGRVTPVGGSTFYHVNGRGRFTLVGGLRFRLSDYCRIRAIYKHGFAWLCLLVEDNPRDNTPHVKGGYLLTVLEG